MNDEKSTTLLRHRTFPFHIRGEAGGPTGIPPVFSANDLGSPTQYHITVDLWSQHWPDSSAEEIFREVEDKCRELQSLKIFGDRNDESREIKVGVAVGPTCEPSFCMKIFKRASYQSV